MKTILIVISFFACSTIQSQESAVFRRSVGSYVKSRHIYRDTDSTQFYYFKITFKPNNKIKNFITYYISPENEVIKFADTVTFSNYGSDDLSKNLKIEDYNSKYLLPFFLKKVKYVVNPQKDYYFSSDDISKLLKILTKIVGEEKDRINILKPLIVFEENPVN